MNRLVIRQSPRAAKASVWNRHTGRQRSIPTGALRFQLAKKFPKGHPLAGQRVYSLEPSERDSAGPPTSTR